MVYLVPMLLIRIFDARVLSGLSGFDTVISIILGAVAGRVIIGHPPTISAGNIGWVTLLCCEAVFGLLRENVRLQRAIHARPTVVLAHGEPQENLMHKTHVTPEDIMSCIRREEYTNPQRVQCGILEPSGMLSVLGYGSIIDPTVFEGVRGADRVLSHDGADPE